ncbi:pancreatic lipase-related protein 2-like [Sipha flava]|nr:pancreatic lipase-related protein 2-like [Sipha flava]
MAGCTIASYQTLLYLFTFIATGEILCQVRNPERIQIPRVRSPVPIAATAQNNANVIGRPSNKQLANKQSSKSQQNSSRLLQQNPPAPPVSVKELFNSSSCVEPPFTCPHPRIQFYLYTRLTQNDPELLDVTDPESLYTSHFNPKHPVKIIIHGFQGGRNLSPSTDLRNAYFTRGNYNIIIVDYSTLAQIPCLNQVEWAPRFCGMCIAQLANYLADHPRGVPPDKLHLMG